MRHQILRIVSFAALCGLLGGCCIFATQAPPGCRVEPKDNALLGFYAVHLRQTNAGWCLSGRCAQGNRYQSTFTVVIAVDILDAQGRSVERHYVHTFPEHLSRRFKDSGLGDFTLWLTQPPPPGAVVSIEAIPR